MTVRSGLHLIPSAAKILAATVFLAAASSFFFFFDEHKSIGYGAAMGAAIGAIADGNHPNAALVDIGNANLTSVGDIDAEARTVADVGAASAGPPSPAGR